LLALRRALRNGTVWIDHSLAFRSRERLFIPAERWQKEHNAYYQRLSLPKNAELYLEPLIERAQAGVAAVAKAVEAGELRVDDELHLTRLGGRGGGARTGQVARIGISNARPVQGRIGISNARRTTHTTPELEFLQAKWAAHVSLAAVADPLHDVLGVSA
jgi:hypothetical protein